MVHERVREHIRQMQVKQSWLAKRMYLSEGALSLILAGKRKMTVDEKIVAPCVQFSACRQIPLFDRKKSNYLHSSIPPMMCESFPWGWRGVPSLEGEE